MLPGGLRLVNISLALPGIFIFSGFDGLFLVSVSQG